MTEASIYDLTHPGWRDEEIARLRAALERTRPHVRDEIIEECARVADSFGDKYYFMSSKEIAAAIRALRKP